MPGLGGGSSTAAVEDASCSTAAASAPPAGHSMSASCAASEARDSPPYQGQGLHSEGFGWRMLQASGADAGLAGCTQRLCDCRSTVAAKQ